MVGKRRKMLSDILIALMKKHHGKLMKNIRDKRSSNWHLQQCMVFVREGQQRVLPAAESRYLQKLWRISEII